MPDTTAADRSVPRTPADAIAWLGARGAHPWLIRHHELVLEAARVLVERVAADLGATFDAKHVLLGAAIHDAGKIEHPQEMHSKGSAHETAGEALLVEEGFPAHVARTCVTHASWSEPRAALEDRLVALADKLWKGKRDDELERAIEAELTAALGRPRWEVFAALDAICADIAADGPKRLERSRVA